jgi:hypothetical protein
MYVVVGIPSYNEADSIAGVVRAADAGLSLLAREFPTLRARIMNADNHSPDGTTAAFLKTETVWEKEALTTPGDPGKGKNILALIEQARAEDADCLLMLDGDLESAEPEWIVNLVRPVLLDTADFVAPEYDRTLFDGSITYHFAWPLVLSLFGRDIHQPIAGDFALGKRLLPLIHHETAPQPAFFYGIDIYLTLTAVTQGLRVATASLGAKLHKPSHPKLITMFPQVANAAALFVAECPPVDREGLSAVVEQMSYVRNAHFAHRNYAKQLLASMLPRAAELCRRLDWLAGLEAEVSTAHLEARGLQAETWSKVLAAWIRHVRLQARDTADWGEELLPFYMIRSVTFWLMVDALGEEAAVKDLKRAPILLHDELRLFARPAS